MKRRAASFIAPIVLVTATLGAAAASSGKALLHDAVFAPASVARSLAHGKATRRVAAIPSMALPTAPPTYSNPLDPTPPVPRPSESPCIVKLFQNVAFAGDALRTAPYTPPASCPGPWSKVVFDWDTSVSDVQYDRTGGVWLGGVELLRETTSEPPGGPISYHTEKDVTEYANVLSSPQPFTAEMANYFASGITGIYYVNAELEFYPVSKVAPAPAASSEPDVVIPISNGTTQPGWATLQSTTQQIAQTVTIPANTERLLLEVYASGHIDDEFWYANVPDADSAAGQGGGTSFREIEVAIDGVRAGVAWPFPYVYSGGFDPGLWIPITGIDTHDIAPYVVDLTPFVGKLNGSAHTISMSVLNAQSFWLVDGDLLAFEDHGSKAVQGALSADTLGPASEQVGVFGYNATAGVGVFHTQATRAGSVSGYVDTSHGRVQTTVAYNGSFKNNFASTGTYNVQQDGSLATTTTVVDPTGTTVTTDTREYPFALAYAVASTTVKQIQDRSLTITHNGATTFSSTLARNLTATDVGAAGVSTVPTNRQSYAYSDSTGACYDRVLQAEAEMLVIDNTSCNTP